MTRYLDLSEINQLMSSGLVRWGRSDALLLFCPPNAKNYYQIRNLHTASIVYTNLMSSGIRNVEKRVISCVIVLLNDVLRGSGEYTRHTRQ